MSRISPAKQVDGTTQATLDAIKAQIGMVPNLYQTFAHAPVVLNGFLAFSETLGGGSLTAREREILALATAQTNGCHYCLSAHTMLGKGAGLSAEQIDAARRGKATNARDHALAALALGLVEKRGAVTDQMLADARAGGLSDGDMIEVVAHVALNTLTNFTNNLAQTDIDFPVVEMALAA